jgi:hypothetical protein
LDIHGNPARPEVAKKARGYNLNTPWLELLIHEEQQTKKDRSQQRPTHIEPSEENAHQSNQQKPKRRRTGLTVRKPIPKRFTDDSVLQIHAGTTAAHNTTREETVGAIAEKKKKGYSLNMPWVECLIHEQLSLQNKGRKPKPEEPYVSRKVLRLELQQPG